MSNLHNERYDEIKSLLKKSKLLFEQDGQINVAKDVESRIQQDVEYDTAETEVEVEAKVVNENGGHSEGSTNVENLEAIDIIHSDPPSPSPRPPTVEAEAEQSPTENAEAEQPVPPVVAPVEPPHTEEVFTFSSSAPDNLIIVTDGDTVTKFPYYTEHACTTKDFIRGNRQGLGDVRFRKWLKVFAALQQKV